MEQWGKDARREAIIVYLTYEDGAIALSTAEIFSDMETSLDIALLASPTRKTTPAWCGLSCW